MNFTNLRESRCPIKPTESLQNSKDAGGRTRTNIRLHIDVSVTMLPLVSCPCPFHRFPNVWSPAMHIMSSWQHLTSISTAWLPLVSFIIKRVRFERKKKDINHDVMTGEVDVAASFSCMKTVNTSTNEWVSESDVILKHHKETQGPRKLLLQRIQSPSSSQGPISLSQVR